jgi:UDP-N-acetylglucosamine 2-epimerase (non-hydrolysing)
MLKVLSIIGTRPEAIKMAPVVRALAAHPNTIQSSLCLTGQHRQMLDQVMNLFNLHADFDLNLMQPNQSLSALTAALFTGLEDVIQTAKPDWILAQGDTTTVLVSALIAFYHNIGFGHVEAGLRTGTLRQPFPEEMNRRLADTLSTLLFAPTTAARDALLKAGTPPQQIHVTGNTVIDALLAVAQMPFDWTNSALAQIDPTQRLVLVTAHRRESFGEPFRNVCLAIRQIAEQQHRHGVHIVFPVHLNPNVRKPVYEILGGVSNISLLEPLEYVDLVHLLKRCTLVLTDSGGIQEEAPSFGVPLLVMRDTTERPEGVHAGVAKLVGTSRNTIVNEATRLLTDPAAHAHMARQVNPYGDGNAAQRIVNTLLAGRVTQSVPVAVEAA